MIFDYVVDAETGSEYKTQHCDTYEEAVVWYNTYISQEWDYVSLRKRTLNRVTLRDEYEVLMEND
jgi:hypothetical protein